MGRAGGTHDSFVTLTPPEQPWHSSQYQALPEVYVQNASLEIAWTRVVREQRLIAGNVVMPFMTQGFEGFDVNQEQDWWYAEYILTNGPGNPAAHNSYTIFPK